MHEANEERSTNALQLELHYRSKPSGSRVTVLFNNVRIIGVFDWILAVKEYIVSPVEDPWKERDSAREGLLINPLIFNSIILIIKIVVFCLAAASSSGSSLASHKPNPLVVSTGVATKRCMSDESSLGDLDEDKSPFEL